MTLHFDYALAYFNKWDKLNTFNKNSFIVK